VTTRPLLASALALVLTACGPKLPPPRFADSATFHGMSGRVHGLLEGDVDGDGQPEAVLAERRGDGYAVSVLHHEGDPARGDWKPWCTTEPVRGEDLDALRWVTFADRRAAVFVLVLNENPEELEQRLAVVDLKARCAVVFEDELALTRAEPEKLVAPASVRGGAVLDDDGGGLVVHEDPGYLHLAGSEGEVLVLTSLRERTVRWADGKVTEAERQLAITRAQPATVTLAGPGGRVLSELTDGDDATRFDVAAGEVELLGIRSERPFVLLELHEGCDDVATSALSLATAGAAPVSLGAAPPAGSFVRAIGRTQGAGVRKELVALREPTASLDLDVGPRERARCLRDVKVYGFSASP
jgi:hypothetical protein